MFQDEAAIKDKSIDIQPYKDGDHESIYGIDMVWAARIPPAPVDEVDEACNYVATSSSSFERLRSDFILEAGQKIGVGVYYRPEFTVDKDKAGVTFSVMKEITEDEVKDAFGEPGMIHIYTGEIKQVFPKHFEHTINTLRGCSGAIIFLLDTEQPESVKPNDYGCAIGIHTGGHKQHRKLANIGVPFTAKEPSAPPPAVSTFTGVPKADASDEVDTSDLKTKLFPSAVAEAAIHFAYSNVCRSI